MTSPWPVLRPGRLSRFAARWELVAPAAVAFLLAIPCLGLGYFWDDFAFLTRAQADPVQTLRYQPETAFYRPLTQGLYFLALVPLGASGAVVAHGINLLLLLASVALLVTLTSTLAGRRAGLLAGLLFAGLAPAASLVGWASGSQDLLAIVFLLAALHLLHSGSTAWAMVAATAALLSKETVIAAWPVLMFWDALLGRRPIRAAPMWLFAGLGLAWATLHPGIRYLAAGGLATGPRGYVGLQNLAIFELHARQYILSLVNVPITGGATPWPWDRAAYGTAALLATLGGLALAAREREEEPRARPSVPVVRVAALGLLLALPMALLPAFFIERGVAYYACLPGLGTSMALGAVVSRAPLGLAAAGLVVYLALGTWSRGVVDRSGTLLTERSFVLGSGAIREVERGFRELHPSFPRGAQILVSVAASGMAGIHGTLQDGQAARIWYGDRSLTTRTPERRLAGAPADHLLRVTAARDVVSIDADRLAYRGTGASADSSEVRAAIRSYARGLAASGEIGHSVRVLELLSRRDPEPLRSYDLRLAAMVLLASGRRESAERLLASAPPLPRDVALDAVAKVMAEPTARADLDSTAYWAFGISPSDPDALRYWMAMFYGAQYIPQAVHFARRLQEVVPGDRESAEILRELEVRKGAIGGP